ncbi:MAG: 2-oxoglutarate dehydrogenase E1 component [Sphingobacteriales bacterium]|nr:MAG: 2-oxoglutarate dehydrogenase E1 component [Sphingobacteriales bacterium]
MKDFSFITHSHPSYIESLYKDYVSSPDSVDPDLRKFFEGFDFAQNGNGSKTNGTVPAASGTAATDLSKEFAVYTLIRSYRKRGHLIADTNPIRKRRDRHAQLELTDFNLSDADLDTPFAAGYAVDMAGSTLRDIIARLQQLYCGHVGIEYTYINNNDTFEWVKKQYEAMITATLSIDQKRRILEKVNEGVIFEKFLHTKYIGQKRFSLEGGESTIAALDTIINNAAAGGVKEVIIGMAHRGRLNILANTLGKTYEQIFTEFEGITPTDTMGSGDVKYHLGFRSDITTPDGTAISVQLTPNPSHLEVVDPIVSGLARAKADTLYADDYDKVMPVLIHGDAAVAGQGVVYELLQMSRLEGYSTGGTIHFVINNQIGFTTDFDDARSADYCTSIAAMVQAPVLHVNGDDPEAVVKAAAFAVAYRQQFNADIFIDMVCYRRHGHNEGDDPSFTQPDMYEAIKKHENPREVYNEVLVQRGDVDAAMAKEMETKFWGTLQERLDEVKQKPLPYKMQAPEKTWSEMRPDTPADFEHSPDTAIPEAEVQKLFKGLMAIPENFTPLPKIKKLLDEKTKLLDEKGMIDWATGELLAYASIVASGSDVRLSGQDVQRGTFSHRHAVLHDATTNEEYNRLSQLAEKQGQFRIYNSLLSEFAVLGFEYGYSIASPTALTLWEAQFGDFVNGAQTVIDQYLSSAETKWNKRSGLVLLLPHGYEGQGPEHSSARMERFLQACAETNLVITNITTSANFFHALRRQVSWPFRKPMINFSPKANLRHPRSYSPMADFTTGGFREVIDDATIKKAKGVKRVLLCSGKIAIDLIEKQEAEGRTDVAIVRLEQIYPTPVAQLEALRKKYAGAEWVWVQEEPRNMGAWTFLATTYEAPLRCISRKAAASPATGFSKIHAKQQTGLLDEAFAV